MRNVKLTKVDVLEAFKQSHFAFSETHFTGVPAAANEFGISRAAIYLWSDDEEIPKKRQLHLYQHRPDIIEKVYEIQLARLSAKPNSTPASRLQVLDKS